jgi:ribonucleoside-diphosphate reductase alpha chain
MLHPDLQSAPEVQSSSSVSDIPVPEMSNMKEGLRVQRRYTKPGVHPYEELEWEMRDAVINNSKGEVTFEQRNVEVPTSWSQLATNVVVQKYFRGRLDTPERESSVRQLIDRVAQTAAKWGREGNYFASAEDADAFEAELTHLLVNQMVSFNSPVWFNCGVEERPQVSACFINSVQDTMGSILDLAKIEGILSSTELMKHADTCGCSSIPQLNQTGELKETIWLTSKCVNSASKASASSAEAK